MAAYNAPYSDSHPVHTRDAHEAHVPSTVPAKTRAQPLRMSMDSPCNASHEQNATLRFRPARSSNYSDFVSSSSDDDHKNLVVGIHSPNQELDDDDDEHGEEDSSSEGHDEFLQSDHPRDFDQRDVDSQHDQSGSDEDEDEDEDEEDEDEVNNVDRQNASDRSSEPGEAEDENDLDAISEDDSGSSHHEEQPAMYDNLRDAEQEEDDDGEYHIEEDIEEDEDEDEDEEEDEKDDEENDGDGEDDNGNCVGMSRPSYSLDDTTTRHDSNTSFTDTQAGNLRGDTADWHDDINQSGVMKRDAKNEKGLLEDDQEPDDIVVKRRPRRSAPLKIPDELLDNGEYFRRSNRRRTAVTRYSEFDGVESSDVNDDDSDFEAGDGLDDNDDNYSGNDDFDSSADSLSRRSRQKSRRTRKKARVNDRDNGTLERVTSIEDNEYSGSDDDWENDDGNSSRRSVLRRKRKRQTSSARKASDDDSKYHVPRVNARTGGAINYAEADDSGSEFFDENDPAASRLSREERQAAENDGTPSIALVCDYRSIAENCTDVSSRGRKIPFSDFHQDSVEFNIHWGGTSFRRNSWHRLEDLRELKGFKKVLNYVKDVLARRAELSQPYVSSEELEEASIIFIENREALAEYTVIDRIVAERESEDSSGAVEYLVKWRNLPYRDCTWELGSSLESPEDVKAIDAYNERIQASLYNASAAGKQRRYNPFSKESRGKFRRMTKQPDYLHGEGRVLREYQLASLNWLAFSWTNRRNVILADEMGLGKTLQTISFLGWIMYERHVPGPFLVVVPLSTIASWVREFARWLPEMNTVCYSGDATSRRIIREHEFELIGSSKSRGTGVRFHVLLTTPELAMMDIEHLSTIRWAMIAVDEAHRLKNKDSELHRSLLELTSANRLLITGTPLQNSIGELWALLHFLNPELFDDANSFEENFSFSALRDEDRVANLHDTLRPYIIRRQKTDVEKSLPKKTYNVLRVGMTSSQQQLYRLLLTKNYAKLNAGAKGKGMGPKTTLRNLVMELKKCCNHPFLFENVEDTSTKTTVETLIRASGKMILLDKLLLRLREKGHRVLIFSQMVRMLDILCDYCKMRCFQFQRLDGSMPNDLRQRAVDHYNAPGSTDFVFLLSTRAGGLGINLATADTVIIFDSDWNPQNDLQAESRAHRIGQTRDVKVFRLLSRETVEEDILERAKRKRVLEHLVIHGVEGDDQDKDGKYKFNKKELSAILRFGAEKLFKENDNAAADPSCNGGGSDGGQVANLPNGDGAGDDAHAEEKRVLEVDDIDELLSRTPAETEDEIGGAEPSMGDSLLNAFKWADFDPIDEEERTEEENMPKETSSSHGRLAQDAAREITSLDERRKREVAEAVATQEREDQELAEDDSEYWNRVIPDSLKGKAVSDVFDEEIVVGTRKRKKVKTFGATDSPESTKRPRRRTKGSKSLDSTSGALNKKEERMIFRSWRKFGDISRVGDILADAGVSNRISENDAHRLLSDALSNAINKVREVDRMRSNSSASPKSGGNADVGTNSNDSITRESVSRSSKSGSKSKGPSPVMVDILGEQVNARDLIQRCSEMELLGRLITQSRSPDTQFRLRIHIKAPAYGVSWKPKHDAMLLVGVYRHGLGNWSRIAADSDLQLDTRMNVNSSDENKGAPDATKLMRRVAALLRELSNGDKATSEKLSRKKSAKSNKTGKKPLSTGRGQKRDHPEHNLPARSANKSRGKERRTSKSNASETSESVMVRALKATHQKTLKELRKLSREDSSLGNEEKIRRTKECLLILGGQITKLSQDRDRVKSELWAYIHLACRTNLPGNRLRILYEKLAENRRQREAVSARSQSIET